MRFIVLISLFLTGCGYSFGQGGVVERYHTFTVPYVEGDHDGYLTTTLIRQLSESGCYDYRNCDGRLRLCVKVVDVDDQNIGFRYDRKKRGKIRKTIIPTETRISATAEVTVYDVECDRALLGPVLITASIDFDHDYYDSRNAVNVFSLGQLTDYDEAYDASIKPLNDVLAKKIVDYVNGSW